MLIDLAKCVGCDACSVACKIENSTPGNIWWAPVEQKEVGKFPKARVLFLPTLCMHCEDPPCVKSCPSKAIYQSPSGAVVINESKCCGSESCVTACPYNAITVWKSISSNPESPNFLEEAARSKHRIGSAQKCTFCSHRIEPATSKGLRIGTDREATPACVIACPTSCRIFGNVEDSDSPVSKYLEAAEKEGRTVFILRPDAKTKPKVAYLW